MSTTHSVRCVARSLAFGMMAAVVAMCIGVATVLLSLAVVSASGVYFFANVATDVQALFAWLFGVSISDDGLARDIPKLAIDVAKRIMILDTYCILFVLGLYTGSSRPDPSEIIFDRAVLSPRMQHYCLYSVAGALLSQLCCDLIAGRSAILIVTRLVSCNLVYVLTCLAYLLERR